MRLSRRGAGVAVVVAAVVLGMAGSAGAAIFEFSFRQGVADSVSVLRYLYVQRQDAKDKLAMVDYSISITKSQLDAHKALILDTIAHDTDASIRKMAEPSDKPLSETVAAVLAPDSKASRVTKLSLDIYKKTLDTLTFQLAEMQKTDFTKIFGDRVKLLTEQMDDEQIRLEAKLTEYRVHFGQEPPVDLEYQEKENRLRPKVETPGILIVR